MNSNRFVLLVEDDPIALYSLRLQMQDILPSHYQIEVANDGLEALEILNEIDRVGGILPIVVTDHQMPGMTGSQFLLRAQDLMPKCRNIMLTGQARFDDITEIVNKQALFRYIAKPWDKHDLELTVLSALEAFNQEYKLEKLNRKLSWINANLEEQIKERTDELLLKTNELNKGLNFAALLQKSLLANSEEMRTHFNNVQLLFRPYQQVSGDFYFFHEFSQSKSMVVIGDATGHGVAGAFLSSICVGILNNIIENEILETPLEVLTNVLQRFNKLGEKADNALQQFVSVELTVLCIDKESGKISYSTNSKQLYLSLNSNPTMIVENQFKCCTGNNKLEHRGRSGECSISEVDTIMLYTDGVPDQFVAANGKKLGRPRLHTALEEIRTTGVNRWFSEIQGNEPNVDDATLILLSP